MSNPPATRLGEITIFPNEKKTFQGYFSAKLSISPSMQNEQGTLVVLGCIDYRTSIDQPTHHQSRVSYSLLFPLQSNSSFPTFGEYNSDQFSVGQLAFVDGFSAD